MWSYGDVVAHRHLCGDRCWMGLPVYVASDEPDLVVTYLPGGAAFRYVDGEWPTETGRHPWHPGTEWGGHGVLMLQRPGDPYGVWVFWRGKAREHRFWYLNIHDWSRAHDGFAIRDLELDVVLRPDGTHAWKDDEYVDQRVAEGRFTAVDAARAREVGRDLTAMLDRGEWWWSDEWASWTPPPEWGPLALPEDWEP
ncbi:MAG TPA: DUF402 domain-containing protein [Frankiaceae bacterium]|nr:DUF402 domain-containing protein [Frankiaceae bacterium]